MSTALLESSVMLSVRPSIFFSWFHLAVGTVLVVLCEPGAQVKSDPTVPNPVERQLIGFLGRMVGSIL